MKNCILLFAAFILLFSSSCSKEKERPKEAPKAASVPGTMVAADSIKARLLEQENFAIPYWLKNGVKGRTLVHISGIEGLTPMEGPALASLQKAAARGDSSGLLSMGGASAGKPVYTTDNTVFAASRLGLVKDVYMVVPSLTSVTQQDLDGFKEHLINTLHARKKEVDQLRLNGRVAEGTINGVHINILALQDLPRFNGPVLLDIDLSYFSFIYQNEKDTRLLSLISGFFNTLRGAGLNSDLVTVSASNWDGVVPYKFRFLAGYLTDALNNPSVLQGDPPKLWSERAEAWKLEQRSYNEAIPLYKTLLKEFPNDAAMHYDLSYAYSKAGDNASARKELGAAAAMDDGYRMAALESGVQTGKNEK